jgi:hypothetical protein
MELERWVTRIIKDPFIKPHTGQLLCDKIPVEALIEHLTPENLLMIPPDAFSMN